MHFRWQNKTKSKVYPYLTETIHFILKIQKKNHHHQYQQQQIQKSLQSIVNSKSYLKLHTYLVRIFSHILLFGQRYSRKFLNNLHKTRIILYYCKWMFVEIYPQHHLKVQLKKFNFIKKKNRYNFIPAYICSMHAWNFCYNAAIF